MQSAVRFGRLQDWLDWQETLHPHAIEPGLDRVERVLARTGWNRPRCPVLTVGGTNGKGSCVAMLEAILREGRYRVCTFTSPHLIDYRERIRIDGVDVSAMSLVAAFERIADALEDDTLTFFEFNTLAALLVFESAVPDTIVLEVGMGGRLDAVNVVDADVAIVSSVGLDHMEWLGGDLETIAREKAGIFRPGRPAIFGGTDPPATLASEAARLGTRLKLRGRDYRAEPTDGEATWRFQDAHWTCTGLPRPSLAGEHQVGNAGAVLAALSELGRRMPLGRDALVRGLRSAFVPGRFQRVRALGRAWILDVAHNPDAARVLTRELRSLRSAGCTFGICAMLADKDVASVLNEMRDVVDVWIAAPTSGSRGLTAHDLATRAQAVGVAMHVAGDLGTAMQDALRATGPADRIVVFGSFHTVGPALEWLRANSGSGDRWMRHG